MNLARKEEITHLHIENDSKVLNIYVDIEIKFNKNISTLCFALDKCYS